MEKILIMLSLLSKSSLSDTDLHIQHFLHNALPSMNQLEKLLIEKNFTFVKNYRIYQYHFDFYHSEFKIGLKVDTYTDDFFNNDSVDSIKKLFIPSLQIHVLKFTDYHILTDPGEIIRAITFLIQNKQNVL